MADEDKDAKEKRDAAKGVVKEAFAEWMAEKEKERAEKDKDKDKKPSGGFLDSLLGR